MNEQRFKITEKGFSFVDLLLICVVIIWGSIFTFGKIALMEFDPTSFAALRTICAAAFLLVVLSLKEKNALHLRKKDILPLAAMGLLGHFLNRFCWSYGLNYTTASNASLIMATTPIHVALFASLLRIERVTIKSTIGIIVALLGLIFVIKGDFAHQRFERATVLGDLFVLGAALSWALYSMYARYLLQRNTILKLTVWSAQFGAAFMVSFIVRALAQGTLVGHSLRSWLCLLYVGIIGNAVAQIFWITGISRIGATKTTVYQTFVPLVAIFVAAVVLEERLLGVQIVGTVLVLGGICLARLG